VFRTSLGSPFLATAGTPLFSLTMPVTVTTGRSLCACGTPGTNFCGSSSFPRGSWSLKVARRGDAAPSPRVAVWIESDIFFEVQFIEMNFQTLDSLDTTFVRIHSLAETLVREAQLRNLPMVNGDGKDEVIRVEKAEKMREYRFPAVQLESRLGRFENLGKLEMTQVIWYVPMLKWENKLKTSSNSKLKPLVKDMTEDVVKMYNAILDNEELSPVPTGLKYVVQKLRRPAYYVHNGKAVVEPGWGEAWTEAQIEKVMSVMDGIFMDFGDDPVLRQQIICLIGNFYMIRMSEEKLLEIYTTTKEARQSKRVADELKFARVIAAQDPVTRYTDPVMKEESVASHFIGEDDDEAGWEFGNTGATGSSSSTSMTEPRSFPPNTGWPPNAKLVFVPRN
jgi:hypothetical protein